MYQYQRMVLSLSFFLLLCNWRRTAKTPPFWTFHFFYSFFNCFSLHLFILFSSFLLISGIPISKKMKRMVLLVLFMLIIVGTCKGDDQLNALNDFFNSTGGSNWQNNSYWGSNNDPCGRTKGNYPWYHYFLFFFIFLILFFNSFFLASFFFHSLFSIFSLSFLYLFFSFKSFITNILKRAGLTCSGGWVTNIELPNNGVGGLIPSSIANIPYLEVVNLNSNLYVFFLFLYEFNLLINIQISIYLKKN